MKCRKILNRRAGTLFLSVILTVCGLSGCKSSEEKADTSVEEEISDRAFGMMQGKGSTEGVEQNLELTESQVDMEFTENDQDSSYIFDTITSITLTGAGASSDGTGVSISGSTVTIKQEGTYILSGSLEEGQIIVDADDKDKIQLVLNGTELHCETSAALYVKNADKVFLTLADKSENILSGGSEYTDTDENTVDGVIFSKDDLTVNGAGSLQIQADYKHGIVSKDDLVVTGGVLDIQAVGQCMSGKDCIKISDGTFTLTSQGKGMKSENTDDSALGNIYIAGGEFNIHAEDDALHAGGSVVIDGGTFSVDTGDDAVHADKDVVVNNGNITVNSCYEGLEGLRVVVNGGETKITASDDGINAANPKNENEQKDIPGGPGDSGMENETEAYIKVTGGILTVDAQGDGLDSNGSLFISGGNTYVNGPVSGADGALDYNGGADITGGVLIAVGSSGMAQGMSESSSQYSILQYLQEEQEASAAVVLTDDAGEEILNYVPGKRYSSVVISCPELEAGRTYTLTSGSESVELILESVVTTSGNVRGSKGMGGRRGGKMMEIPDTAGDMEKSERPEKPGDMEKSPFGEEENQGDIL